MSHRQQAPDQRQVDQWQVDNGDPAKGEEKVAPPAGERVGFGSGRMPSAGIPMEKSLNFGPSVKRLLRRMGPDRRLLGVVFVLAVIGVTLVVFGPRCWATRPT